MTSLQRERGLALWLVHINGTVLGLVEVIRMTVAHVLVLYKNVLCDNSVACR